MKTNSALVYFFVFLKFFAEARSRDESRCEIFTCGNLDFKFPFFDTTMSSRCGLFKMNCSNEVREIQLVEKGEWYKVKSVSQANTITITDPRLNQSLLTGDCTNLSSYSLPYSPWLDLTTLYKCNDSGESRLIPRYSNQSNVNATLSLHIKLPRGCVRCHNHGGECKMIKGKYRCDGATKEHKKGQERLKLGLVIGGSFILIIILVIFIIIIQRICTRKNKSQLISRDNSKSDVGFSHVLFNIPIFSYKELQEATNNFSKNRLVGDGGFGTVYYGKVSDGREVAVKRLYEHNHRRVEQFMNEIEILTRLRHKNLVSLYGCTSRRSQELLLVYEFVPNGTVADHLYGDNPSNQSYLTWSMRMSIALETASALAYLHASDIIHRDVKTTNILLDGNFGVKVADFGLSRLFPSDVTHISTAPQGTPGYVDPEYHQCYHLTDKSDVYSFGVVLVELISSKPAVDISRSKSEINLSSLAINKIQKHATHELIDQNLGYATNEEVRKMTTMVAELAFQCLQQDNAMRPTMEQVVQELKGIQKNVEKKCHEIIMTQHPSPSDWDEASLLKNIKFPRSPISVTHQWTSKSTTPNTSTCNY